MLNILYTYETTFYETECNLYDCHHSIEKKNCQHLGFDECECFELFH